MKEFVSLRVKALSKKFTSHKFKLYLLYLLFFFAALGFIISVYFSYKNEGHLVFIKADARSNMIYRKYVFVSGAIATPGVYEITDQSRVIDVINQAGGFSDQADKEFTNTQINLAERVNDGDHIFIPFLNSANNASQASSGLININTASVEELDTLPGIGPSTAEKIIENRPYNSVEDLLNVSGIGDAKFNEIKNQITVN